MPIVGSGYWRGFVKRNKDRLVSKRGQKYDLSRDKWTSCQNFKNMYRHKIAEMKEADVEK